MITQFFSGARYLGQGVNIIRQPGLRRFVAIPLSINIIIFLALIAVAFHYYSALIDYLTPDFLAEWSDIWLIGWVFGFLEALMWMLFSAAVLVVMTYTFTLLANFIAAPFNSLLAEKVEHHLRGSLEKSNESFGHILRSIPKTMASEVRKLLYLLLWMIPLLILSVIPVLNFVAPLAWFAFGAWMLALEYVDYPMGNHGFRFGDIKRYMRQHRPLALGFGGGVTLMTAIPVVNLFAMPVAVAGATAAWVDALSEGAQSSAA